MNRCSFCEWIPILPLPVWPLAGQFLLGQNVVVGSMTLLLALRGNIATRSMSGPPFALQLHRTTVWCGATDPQMRTLKLHFPDHALPTLDTFLKQTKEARVFRRAQAVREVVKGHRLQTVSDTLH